MEALLNKPFAQVCKETLENRLMTPSETISLAKRMHRIKELREKYGFKSRDNSKAYYKAKALHNAKAPENALAPTNKREKFVSKAQNLRKMIAQSV